MAGAEASRLTPAEEDLPLMISVDHHVMEPNDLWQQQLPPSKRGRGGVGGEDPLPSEIVRGGNAIAAYGLQRFGISR